MALIQALNFKSSGGDFQDLSLAQRERKKKKPEQTVKTAEEAALERRQRSLLDDEIEESEERFKALARGKLGRRSLLSGAPSTIPTAAGASRASSGGGGSLLGGSPTGTSRPGSAPIRGGTPTRGSGA